MSGLCDGVYPVPQNTPHVSANEPRSETFTRVETSAFEDFRIGVNDLNFPIGKRPKAADVGPWNGVYPVA